MTSPSPEPPGPAPEPLLRTGGKEYDQAECMPRTRSVSGCPPPRAPRLTAAEQARDPGSFSRPPVERGGAQLPPYPTEFLTGRAHSERYESSRDFLRHPLREIHRSRRKLR